MIKEKNNKGITLIALIITIILLLILVMVSIRLIVQDGIITKTDNAVYKYQEEEINEKIKIAHTDYKMSKYLNEEYTFEQALQKAKVIYKSLSGNDSEGYSITVDTIRGEKTYLIAGDGLIEETKTLEDYGLKIGDYINYDPTIDENGKAVAKQTYISYSESNANASRNNGRTSGYTSDQTFEVNANTGGWKVLGVENGRIKLISANPILTTSDGLYFLRGVNGYKYGEGELDGICSLYAQGKGAVEGRSIDVDDINGITEYNPNTEKYNESLIDEYENDVEFFWDGTGLPYYKTTNNLKNNLTSSFSKFYFIKETDGLIESGISKKSENATTSDMEEIIKVRSNFYKYRLRDFLNINSAEYKMLLNSNSTYWLNSNYIVTDAKYRNFMGETYCYE